MEIIRDPEALQQLTLRWRREGNVIGLVPTMGYFHEGHLSLMREARGRADKVITSLFVNPTQFGPNEDLDAYPRDEERDAALAEEAGVDVLFCPNMGDMYDKDAATWVEVPTLATNLCGASRPTHFRGVCTIVTKLFMLAQPHVAVFGQKDWQQLAIIRRMTRDLNIPVEIIGHAIVREDDGLARSSRNVYLTESERQCAPFINKGLEEIENLAKGGEHSVTELKQHLASYYALHMPESEIDYIELVHPQTLADVDMITDAILAAVAVRMSKARLIDNRLITV